MDGTKRKYPPANKQAKKPKSMDEDDEDVGGNGFEAEDWDDDIEEDQKIQNWTEAKVEMEEDQWKRPPLPEIVASRDSVAIQQLEADYGVGMSPSAYNGGNNQRSAIIRFYGVNENGNSVLVHVHGFLPYFYIACPDNFNPQDLQVIGESLNNTLREQAKEKGLARHVMNVDVVTKQSIWGYKASGPSRFMKITVAVPSLVATARRLLEHGNVPFKFGRPRFETYESNLPYVLRFMVDKNVVGGGWIELPANKYSVRDSAHKESYCQLEVDCHYDDVIAHEATGRWMKMAPLRILSVDIECSGRKGVFPQADQDPVIQIANVLTIQDSKQPVSQSIFTLKGCSPIVGAKVISSEDEKDMLMKWRTFLIESDCDVLTGYNIINFDLPYLLDRAKALKLEKFPFLGRIIGQQTRMKDATFSSKAYGTHENKDIKIEGRIQFDLLPVIRREHKLRSYTLNAVCAHFLAQQKEDVHYSIISDLQNGDDETRRRLAVYCLKDAKLPLQLMEKLMLMINFTEMARVTGVPISYLLTRGQQIKVVSQLYRKAKTQSLVIPVKEKFVSEEKYEGATVFEPKKGFYNTPIATLDFASLYPSIMMAHNLCYTTMISSQEASTMKPEDYVKTPTSDHFVKSHVRRGILPEILQDLLSARKEARKQMKEAKDPYVISVLNGRQLALKISANSVYGFTGAQVGQLPCLAISSSVTGFGRQMIEHTMNVVRQKFTKPDGKPADVIYGDTDSVMVDFGLATVKETMEMGAKAAEIVSQEFIQPIKLEFEKVYYPYLLMNKKRYAGLYWTNDKKWDKMDTKGIETVRRDNCALVAEVVTEILHKILIEQSPEGAVEYAKQVISDLLCNKMDLSLLVISKSLGAKSEDYAAKVAHVMLAERMRKRDPSTAPNVGDRVAYVIKKAGKGVPAYEKAEDPIYVLEHDIPIDTTYYVENQLKLPLTRIFEPVMGDVSSIFSGDHTLKVKVTSSQEGGLMKFAVKKRTCLGCKALLNDGESSVCAYCQPRLGDLYMERVERVRENEDLYSRVWVMCQRCQGSLHQDVLCTSRDCPIFYRRKKVQKDLAEAQAALDSFSF